MKIKALLLAGLLCGSNLASADPMHENRFDVSDAVAEILLLRPLGILQTLAGTGFFVAISPLTGIASIAPPHDAFQKTADLFIVKPFENTFKRPLGQYDFD